MLITLLILACCLNLVHPGRLNTGLEKILPKRFLMDENIQQAWTSTEQFASCSLTCVNGYEKLTEVCCKQGLDIVCTNLPWDILKAHLGTCASNVRNQSNWVSTKQFAACNLTCVSGYEKLTEACCNTGVHIVCDNLPWNSLTPQLGTCSGTAAPTQVVPPTSGTDTQLPTDTCRDTIDNCALYGRKACIEPIYRPWAKSHCSVSCGFCTPVTLIPFVCQDKVSNCDQYDTGDLCKAEHYFAWARENCLSYCGFPPCGPTLLSNTATPTASANSLSTTKAGA